ncbi:hypothetical protein IQ25_00971 [Novosphingobium taihuense]|uniref:Uncharacterized protein n=1 Tax=Novosphingobium taihuense TaxID=260085 RepID=A0A7W7A7E1_9SPHN|nr:hypothetical protein [Novosphingobium taihuense]TWH88845.1 hypothetical protein IQ25_00971 [Novosphingobium taihuense]
MARAIWPGQTMHLGEDVEEGSGDGALFCLGLVTLYWFSEISPAGSSAARARATFPIV